MLETNSKHLFTNYLLQQENDLDRSERDVLRDIERQHIPKDGGFGSCVYAINS